MDRTFEEIEAFVRDRTGERTERAVEGPAVLGQYVVWRVWTNDGREYHAHYVVAEEGVTALLLFQDFQPFANWLMRAFNVSDAHGRRLDWLRAGVAATIMLVLLALVVWAVLTRQAANLDFKWLAAALATTSLGYLLGGWVRVPRR